MQSRVSRKVVRLSTSSLYCFASKELLFGN